MPKTIKDTISDSTKMAIEDLQKEGVFPSFPIPEKIQLDIPSNPSYGDYSSRIAFDLAKVTLRSPLETAKLIVEKILRNKPEEIEKSESISGFINFSASADFYQENVLRIINEGKKYGQLKNKGKIQVEFISANPTGPLTLGNARGGFFGDVLGNVLEKAGYKVEKAYYINDYGMQILSLGHSVLKDSEAVYKGDYIDSLNERIRESDPLKAGKKALQIILEKMIKKTIKRMRIEYDEWISEEKIHQSGVVDQIIKDFEKKGLVYQEEGAKWFKAKKYGDIRDRVLVKKDGTKTYLAGDAGLHHYKFAKKKFDKVINIWGADHYGDVKGLLAVVEALGFKGKLEVILLQFVTLIKDGQPFKMSKRLGTYVTVDELLDLVSLDVARFFFLSRSSDTHLNFDLELAKEQSDKNPVFYTQYAYARICSILKKAKVSSRGSLKNLIHPSELALMKEMAKLPDIIEETSQDYQLQRLPEYSHKLASLFHQFYRDCRVIGEDKSLSSSRLSLIKATKIVFEIIFGLMGISNPEKM